jgi:hypothetical protein
MANKYVNQSLVIREMKIKTTLRFHLTQLEHCHHQNTDNSKYCRGCGETRNPYTLLVGMQTSTTTMERSVEIPQMSYDPVIPLLVIHPKGRKAGYSRDTCIPVFITALFTIAKLWKQPRCPATDKWIKKLWCTYTMEYSQPQ